MQRATSSICAACKVRSSDSGRDGMTSSVLDCSRTTSGASSPGAPQPPVIRAASSATATAGAAARPPRAARSITRYGPFCCAVMPFPLFRRSRQESPPPAALRVSRHPTRHQFVQQSPFSSAVFASGRRRGPHGRRWLDHRGPDRVGQTRGTIDGQTGTRIRGREQEHGPDRDASDALGTGSVGGPTRRAPYGPRGDRGEAPSPRRPCGRRGLRCRWSGEGHSCSATSAAATGAASSRRALVRVWSSGMPGPIVVLIVALTM